MLYTARIWRDLIKKESMMARKYAELRAQLSPEVRARSEQATKDLIAEMALSELDRKSVV